MTDTLLSFLAEPFVVLCVGMVCSFCAAASQASIEKGRVVWPVEFVRNRPYRVVMGVLASVAVFAMMAAAGEATPFAAFGIGYAGSDLLQRMADAAEAKAAGRV